jgi:proteasome activator subunit 3 (PA28 gamma)
MYCVNTLTKGNRKRSSTGIILESQKSNVAVELKISDTNKSLRSSKSETDEADEEEEEVETPVIEPNQKVLDLFSELKPPILRLAENCVILRNWIVILIPKAEDGNNFGVEVQEQCIVKLIEVEKQMNQILEEHAAYHLERSTLLSKLLSNGEISDYSQCIFDADERQCRKLQNIAHTLRSSYNLVYQTITNNFDKITKPRGQTNNHLHLY